MEKNIIDEETGMTELDWSENMYGDDLVVL